MSIEFSFFGAVPSLAKPAEVPHWNKLMPAAGIEDVDVELESQRLGRHVLCRDHAEVEGRIAAKGHPSLPA
jgi:hypothetical protein